METTISGSFAKGDILSVNISNSFWKVLKHWILRKNLKRTNKYIVTEMTNSTELGIEKL